MERTGRTEVTPFSFFITGNLCTRNFHFQILNRQHYVGAVKLNRVRENSNFFRSELQKMGFEVLGDQDSPVMPIMLYNPSKIIAFSRECFKRNVSQPTMNRQSTLGFFFAITSSKSEHDIES